MSASATTGFYTPEEYLDQEFAVTEYKSEYFAGEISRWQIAIGRGTRLISS